MAALRCKIEKCFLVRPHPRWGKLHPPWHLRRLDSRAFGARLCSSDFLLGKALRHMGFGLDYAYRNAKSDYLVA